MIVVEAEEEVEKEAVDALDDRKQQLEDNEVEVEIDQKRLEAEVVEWLDIEEVVLEVEVEDTVVGFVDLEVVGVVEDTLEDIVEVVEIEVVQVVGKIEVDREYILEGEGNMEDMDMEMGQIEDG